MFRFLQKLFGHSHDYRKPIISQYWSSNTRRIVYECSCGARELRKEYYKDDEEQPIATHTHLSNSDLLLVLKETGKYIDNSDADF